MVLSDKHSSFPQTGVKEGEIKKRQEGERKKQGKTIQENSTRESFGKSDTSCKPRVDQLEGGITRSTGCGRAEVMKKKQNSGRRTKP